MRLIYCYDAYCAWCFAFSPIIKQIQQQFQNIPIDVVSGGLLLPNYNMPIDQIASPLLEQIENIQQHTGVEFGSDYLWHLTNPQLSDWFPNSKQPAIALSIIKEIDPNLALSFALDIEYALNFEGRDLTDLEAYRHLMPKYNMEFDNFVAKMSEEKYYNMALSDFKICQQLKVNSFPALFLQTNENKFYLLASGYTNLATIQERITNIENNIKAQLN